MKLTSTAKVTGGVFKDENGKLILRLGFVDRPMTPFSWYTWSNDGWTVIASESKSVELDKAALKGTAV